MLWRETRTIHIYIIDELNLRVSRHTINSKRKNKQHTTHHVWREGFLK